MDFKFGDKVKYVDTTRYPEEYGRYICHARHSGYLVPFVFVGSDQEWLKVRDKVKAEVETLDFDLASNVLNSCNYNRPDDCEITESDILAKLPASVLSDNQVKLCANVLAVRCGFVVKTLDEMRKLLDTDQEYCHDVATYYPTDVDYKDGSMDTADREIVMEMLARYFGTKTWPYVGFQLVIEDYIGLKTMVHNAEQNEAWEINEVVYDTIKKSELKLKKLKNQIEVGLKMYV